MNDEAAGRETRAASAIAGRPTTGPAQRRAPAAADASVTLHDVHMSYGRRPVLRGLSCSFPAGAISVVLGGSGSGKSTILKLIGGLIEAQAGASTWPDSNVVGLAESAALRRAPAASA